MDVLQPSLSVDQLLPPRTAFMARTSLDQTRLLGFKPYNQDAVTSLLAGLLGTTPAVRHIAGATPAILAAYRDAGLKVDEDQRLYQTEAEAISQARRLVDEGFQLFYPYPLPTDLVPDHGLLVAPDLWHRLNSKDRLAEWAPPEHLAQRQVLSARAARTFVPSAPVWIKAAGAQATGWGYAVRYCARAADYATNLAEMLALPGVLGVVVEEDIAVRHCWCLSIGITDHAVSLAGWAEQEFSAPGRQSGSIINPEAPPPIAAQQLALNLGQRAQGMGYRGFAGFDIGQASDGRVIVFDPNFRFNSSTPMAMFYPAMQRRSGLPAARGFNLQSHRPLADLLERVKPAVDAGWFLPTRYLDGALLPTAEGKSVVTGFVMAEDLAGTQVRSQTLMALLDG